MSANGVQINGQTTDVAVMTAEATQAAPVTAGFWTREGFELMQRAAKLLAASTLVPKEYQGNISNCVIALNMAQRLGADPLMVMQNLYVVHGRPAWSSQFLISTFNASGRFSALRYEWVGKPGTDDWGCRAWAIELATGEKLVGSTVTIGLAKKEGWYNKQGSKWQTMPEQMLMYRAASWFVRAYAPEIAMGLHTVDELRDTIDLQETEYTVKPSNGAVRDLNARIQAAQTQEQAAEAGLEPQPSSELTPEQQQFFEEMDRA